MKMNDNWEYICRATMAKKYTVASVMIVRTTAENLSALILWKMHQEMMMNADRSVCFR